MFFLQPSQKRLLSSLNPLFLVGAVLFLIVIRTTWHPFASGWFNHWDILLPFSIYFGQRRSIAEGMILTLFTSHIYSLSSAAPIGVFTTHYLVLFMISRLLCYVIYANTWISVLGLTFFLSLFSRISLTVVASAFGHGWPFFSLKNFVWWVPFSNTILGFLVFRLLERMDSMTYKVPRINIELAEDGL